MTTLDFPVTNTKENKIQAITMLVIKAEKELEYNKLHNEYGLANRKSGFMNGLIEGKDHLTIKHFLNIQDTVVWAETKFSIALGNHDYGKCDYWHIYRD